MFSHWKFAQKTPPTPPSYIRYFGSSFYKKGKFWIKIQYPINDVILMWYMLISWGCLPSSKFSFTTTFFGWPSHKKHSKLSKTPQYKSVQSKHWNIWVPIFAHLYMCDVGNSALMFCMFVCWLLVYFVAYEGKHVGDLTLTESIISFVIHLFF